MNTSILTVALASMVLTGQNAAPTWQTNYSQAQQQGTAQSKPLVVVFGSGPNGWSKVVRDASPTAEVTQLMGDKYVCVYVDTASPAGKQTAQNFGIAGNTGLVISDRTGSLQAFWHQGDVSGETVGRVLTRYSDPQRSVRTTETNTSRTSFYPSSSPEQPTSVQGGTVNWGANGGGSYCPSCNNARGRR